MPEFSAAWTYSDGLPVPCGGAVVSSLFWMNTEGGWSCDMPENSSANEYAAPQAGTLFLGSRFHGYLPKPLIGMAARKRVLPFHASR